MFGADIALLAMYTLGFLCTGMIAFAVFIPAMLVSVYIGWALVDSFPAEYMYFLAQSMVWVLPALALRKCKNLAICCLMMCVYEWLVAVESFIWQFVIPVETALHSQYAFIIIGIHLFILSITAKWGGEIGYTYWRGRHRSVALPNL